MLGIDFRTVVASCWGRRGTQWVKGLQGPNNIFLRIIIILFILRKLSESDKVCMYKSQVPKKELAWLGLYL